MRTSQRWLYNPPSRKRKVDFVICGYMFKLSFILFHGDYSTSPSVRVQNGFCDMANYNIYNYNKVLRD